jgi:NTF2 fold immunity protein
MKQKILFLLVVFILDSCKKNQENRSRLGKDFARKELQRSLSDSTLHNIINSKSEIIKDSETAISIAEKILFKIYGQEEIERQRPYEIYKLDNFWVIFGTIPTKTLGGTFTIIMDSNNGRVVRLTHSK